jgi:hypothetical protein
VDSLAALFFNYMLGVSVKFICMPGKSALLNSALRVPGSVHSKYYFCVCLTDVFRCDCELCLVLSNMLP